MSFRPNLDSYHSLPEAYVGMPCTICHYTDSDPAEVVEVKGKTIKVRLMDYEVISGFVDDGSAKYKYMSNPENPLKTFTLRKNGRYIRKGEDMRNGTCVSLGFARRYYDPHF